MFYENSFVVAARTLRGCLHEISFWVKQNIFNSVPGQYLVTVYMICPKIKLFQVLFHFGCFDRNEVSFQMIECYVSPRNSTWQSAIAEGFAEVDSVFIVITSAKILSRWLFPSKIYIQFTICNTFFSTKLSFTNKRYHLHVLEKRLYVLQEVRSFIYFPQFIHPLSLRSRGNGTSFAFTSYIIVSAKFCNVTFLNNFYFVSFFYHLFICRR